MANVLWHRGFGHILLLVLLYLIQATQCDEYSVIISTRKNKDYDGTNDRVYAAIEGNNGKIDSFALTTGRLGPGSTRWFTAYKPDVGIICGLTLKVGNDGWAVDTVQIVNTKTLRGAKFVIQTLIDGDDNLQLGAKPSVTKNISVNGGWGEWGDWNKCDAKCGVNGTQQRTRECDAPKPGCGGSMCAGERVLIQECAGPPCRTITTTTTTTTTVTSVTSTPNGVTTTPTTTTIAGPKTTTNICNGGK